VIGAVEVAKSEDVNDAASRSIQADLSFGSNIEFRSVDEERCCVKAMPANGSVCARLALVTGERKIDDRRDVVNESMSCQRRCEAEGRVRCSNSNFEQVVVNVKSWVQVDAPTEHLNVTVVASRVELSIRNPHCTCVGEGERRRKLLVGECRHVDKCSHAW
jgi:hypothetical protein